MSTKSSNNKQQHRKKEAGRSGRRGVIAAVAALALVLGCTAAFGFVSTGSDDASPQQPSAPSAPSSPQTPAPTGQQSDTATDSAGEPTSGSPGKPADDDKKSGAKGKKEGNTKEENDKAAADQAGRTSSDAAKTDGDTPQKDEPAKKPNPLRDGLPASTPQRLVIPAIDVNSKLAKLGLADDQTIELPAPAKAGWYTRSPSPGEIGPAIVSGFINTAKKKGVFSELSKLKPGNKITVHRTDGKAVVFEVDKIKLYPKGEFVPREVYASKRKPFLRIVTVGGTMKPNDEPGNVVVFSHLASVKGAGSKNKGSGG